MRGAWDLDDATWDGWMPVVMLDGRKIATIGNGYLSVR